jgi:hypothetical protein
MGHSQSIPEEAQLIEFGPLLRIVKTGDVILFSGRGFYSSIIRFGGLGKNWSHVGVIIKDEKGVAYVIESNPPIEGLLDIITGSEKKSGPRMSKLSDRIKGYDGYFIAIRYLENEGPKLARNRLRESLVTFVRSRPRTSKYDYNVTHFWGAAMQSNVDDSENYYCTKFAAGALMKAGILAETKPCENFTLDDFSSLGQLCMKGSWYYEEEVYLELPIKSLV